MVKYFAYGSNLNLEQMQRVLGRSRFKVSPAILENYELIFTDNCVASYANIVEKKGAKVVGLVYDLTTKDIAKLDNLEKNGFGGYKRVTMSVCVGRKTICSEAYVMCSSHCNKRMTYAYLATMLSGMLANNFSYEYIREIVDKAKGVVV